MKSTQQTVLILSDSMNADVHSPRVKADRLDAFSVQAVVSAASSPVGYFVIEVRSSEVSPWDELPSTKQLIDGTTTYVSGIASFSWDIGGPFGFPHARLTYKRTSGSAALAAYLNSVVNVA